MARNDALTLEDATLCLCTLIAKQMAKRPEEVTPATRFVEDLHGDSLDAIEIIMATEDAFDISIPDEAMEGFHTVADLAKYVVARDAGY